VAVSNIKIRFATAEDTGLLLRLIRELAAYERAPNAVVATEEDLRRYGFGLERQFEALLAFLSGEPAGLALFHPRFSTWLGRPGVYLEDLFVTQAALLRGKQDEKTYCLTGECSPDVKRCLTARVPVASLISRPSHSSPSQF